MKIIPEPFDNLPLQSEEFKLAGVYVVVFFMEIRYVRHMQLLTACFPGTDRGLCQSQVDFHPCRGCMVYLALGMPSEEG